MSAKALQTIANRIVDGIPRSEIQTVAAIGFKGELPDGLDADDRFDLLNMIQDSAKCVEAGAYSRGLL